MCQPRGQAWPGRGSPLQSWRQARSTGVTCRPQTDSLGKTFLLVTHATFTVPPPSLHSVTEGVLKTKTRSWHLPAASMDSGITLAHTAQGHRVQWSRVSYYPAFCIFSAPLSRPVVLTGGAGAEEREGRRVILSFRAQFGNVQLSRLCGEGATY